MRPHEPHLWSDMLLAALAFLFIWASTHFSVTANSELDRSDLVIGGFCCIGFSLLIIFGLGANIAVGPLWSRSYPLIVIHFASVTIVFARLYELLGMVDSGHATNKYSTALYLSLITIANLGSGDVLPSTESRFVAATESLIGYASLAFFAALLFTTMQRGMRAQTKRYNKRRLALIRGASQAEQKQIPM